MCSEPCQTSQTKRFPGNNLQLKAFIYICKTLHLKCFTRFWKCVWKRLINSNYYTFSRTHNTIKLGLKKKCFSELEHFQGSISVEYRNYSNLVHLAINATLQLWVKSWNLFPLIISPTCNLDNQTIAPRKNCPLVRVKAWLRVSFGVRGEQLSSGAIVLEPQFCHISFSFNLTRNINFLLLGWRMDRKKRQCKLYSCNFLFSY